MAKQMPEDARLGPDGKPTTHSLEQLTELIEERGDRLQPMTVSILKILKKAEEERIRLPTEEEIQYYDELEKDTSLWGYVRWTGHKTWTWSEYIGEICANALGLTAPRYDSYIKEYYEIQEKEEKELQEKLARLGEDADQLEGGFGDSGEGSGELIEALDFEYSYTYSSGSESESAVGVGGGKKKRKGKGAAEGADVSAATSTEA